MTVSDREQHMTSIKVKVHKQLCRLLVRCITCERALGSLCARTVVLHTHAKGIRFLGVVIEQSDRFWNERILYSCVRRGQVRCHQQYHRQQSGTDYSS